MRSIRRSLLGYLLVLIALALGAVGVLVDRFANAAIRTREASEANRIEHAFSVRQQEAKAKFDADLLAEAKALATEVQYKTAVLLGQNNEPMRRLTPLEQIVVQAGGAVLGQNIERRPGGVPGGFGVPGGLGWPGRSAEAQPPLKATTDEAREFRLRSVLMEFAPGPNLLAAVAPVAAVEPFIRGDQRRHHPYPNWVEFDGPRVVARVQESLRAALVDDDHARPYQFQVTLVATYPNRPGRNVATLGAVEAALPVAPAFLEPTADAEPKLDDVNISDLGSCRRVVSGTTPGGRPIGFFVPLPAPPAPAVHPRYKDYPPFRVDMILRVVVHTARPYSELDARLSADQKERDDQLTRVQTETRAELANLRARLTIIGTVTFAALVLGGWFLVARGLAPLRALSDAVSRVSEKDFRLPVEAAELGRELAPIHARITQTLTLLQRAFAREKQAVADISHELRTPIAALLATIDVSLRKPRTPEQYRTTLEECRLISKQLGQLVERIMTLASLDAGNDHTHVVRTDIGELATGCTAVIRPLAAANNIRVAVHAEEEVMLDTDPGKLREVLMNLLHNAVEYNNPDGVIELNVRRLGETAVFEVRDTGIGMTAEVRDRIFERFYRADSSRHATGVHAGLGLAIVKEYVARLNGSIVVESEPGKGTTFRVTLPAPTVALTPVPAERAKASRAVPAGS